MEHQEIYEWLKELAFKNCDKENREQIFWFFEDILEDEIKVEKQEDEIERLNNIINELEKWVREDKECFETQFYMGRCVNFQCILDKLQELKGSNDNE